MTLRKVASLELIQVKDENGDLVTDFYSIFARWMNQFSQLLNIHMPEPSVFEIELAIEKLNSHKSPGIDQIPAELIKERGRIIFYEIH
jgi:hypothetical protein